MKLKNWLFPSKQNLNITLLGSCLPGFVRDHLLKRTIRYYQPVFHTQLVSRSDVALDMIHGIVPDFGLIRHYLDNGTWKNEKTVLRNGNEVSYAQFFTSEMLYCHEIGKQFTSDTPDLLIMDSLHDLSQNLYRHKIGKWKALFGRITFDNLELQNSFDSEFEYIHQLSIPQITNNIQELFEHFYSHNKNFRFVFMHFPFLDGYPHPEIKDKDRELKDAMQKVVQKLGAKHFLLINNIPSHLYIPLTDSTHPNYSSDIWNHFYPEMYDFFADKIVKFIK